MQESLNILLITNTKHIKFHTIINENILESSNLEDSMKSIINQSIDIIIIFHSPQIGTSLEFINYIDFINLNFGQIDKYYIFIESNQSEISQKLYAMNNTYFFNKKSEEKLQFNNIKKQISLIKKNILLSSSQKYYNDILNENRNSLLLNYTLNSIHASMKESLNILSLKNGKHFLNDLLKTNTIPEYNKLENLLLSISKQINSIDEFLNEKTNQNLEFSIITLEPILRLYYHSYDFSFLRNFKSNDHCTYQYMDIVISLLFMHIIRQVFTNTKKIAIEINTEEVNKQLLISLSLKVDSEIIFLDSLFIKLAKIIVIQNNQTLNIKHQKYGYTFSIFQ